MNAIRQKIRWSYVALVLLAWVPFVAPYAYGALWQWSETASNNASADPTINWRVGMAPSQVSPSARAMMAAVAAWRDDISGALQDTGTSTAYVVTTNQGLANGSGWAPVNGQMIAFVPANTSGIAVTLTVDGGNAYPIQTTPGTAAPSGTLIVGTPYEVTFNSTANTTGAWILRGLYGNPYSIPLGGLMAYTGTTTPNSNFILPAGQCISTTTYATYWALIGSPASGSCPGGQFAVIDLRGRSVVALDNLNGTAAGRLTSSSAGCGTAMTSIGAVCANGVESAIIPQAQLPAVSPTFSGTTQTWYTNYSQLLNGGASGGYGAGAYQVWSSPSQVQPSITVTPAGTISALGSGQSRPQVPPTIGVAYILRVI
jgi:hypothetical protein